MTTTADPTTTGAAAPAAKSGGGLTAAAATYLDERTSVSVAVKEFGRKIFPDHWSFMLGEVALYSFVVILLTGTWLTFFFNPSMAETHYAGSYAPLKGVEMSVAMSSSLDISFDIRGGLLMRQIHHWAALLFVASIGLHMLRIYFTGAFRKPRELNWFIGFVLFILAMAEGFTGYSLPDDLLSGNGLRIIDGMVKGIPVIGTWISFLLFGGEFPGTHIIPRLYRCTSCCCRRSSSRSSLSTCSSWSCTSTPSSPAPAARTRTWSASRCSRRSPRRPEGSSSSSSA